MPIDELLRDIAVIDADSHVVEPYDLWTSRVSLKKWGDKVPHVVWDDEFGSDVWMASGQYLGSPGKTATAGFDKPWPDHPKRWSDINPELWRAEDRLGLMTRYGIYGAILYPNISLFGNSHLSSAAEVDPQLGLDLVRAYNDFLIDYCSADPHRYIPVMGVPFWDLDASIREMDKLRLRPPLDGGVPHGIYVTGAPFPILQIDWPGWLCHSGIIRGPVGNIEFKLALRSVAAKDGLIAYCLYDRACE